MSSIYIERAKSWLSDYYDAETRSQVERMLNNPSDELVDAFYKNLEFGTGGLRGVMGAGTNRVNKYTIGIATQGFANYMKSCYDGTRELSVAIAYDNRNNSSFFASVTADVFTANGFKVYLFESLRPTPVLSFAVRHYNCMGGVMITASHNPPEYNGYKVYWEDGAQIISPHDKRIIDEVRKIKDPSAVKFKGDNTKVISLGNETDELYLDSILSICPSVKDEAAKQFKIVYTPLHGTGVNLVPLALKESGFYNVLNVPEQDINDGDFPTVTSPNPEEPAALAMALEVAEKQQADIVLATDPDADRVGVAVRDDSGKLILLNGNQMASLLTYYLLSRREELKVHDKLPKETLDGYMVKTIVTTNLMREICNDFGVDLYDVLTGFKYIAGVVRENEGRRYFVGGGEESYGFNAGECVRDKDAVITCVLIAETVAWASSKGLTIYQLLLDLYIKYGLYYETLHSITKKGKKGQEEIDNMMDSLRSNPPGRIGGEKVDLFIDYLTSEAIDLETDTKKAVDLPKSNVLQFICKDKSVISVRPSGTEPKIKFYSSVCGLLSSRDQFAEQEQSLKDKTDKIFSEITIF
jgi:phosphoglucomutase